jgi:hypothetical protein
MNVNPAPEIAEVVARELPVIAGAPAAMAF